MCVVRAAADGSYDVLHTVGNPAQLIYLRSAIKYVQVLPLVESGAVDRYGFTVRGNGTCKQDCITARGGPHSICSTQYTAFAWVAEREA